MTPESLSIAVSATTLISVFVGLGIAYQKLSAQIESVRQIVLGSNGYGGVIKDVQRVGDNLKELRENVSERFERVEADGSRYSRHRMNNHAEAIGLLVDAAEIPRERIKPL